MEPDRNPRVLPNRYAGTIPRACQNRFPTNQPPWPYAFNSPQRRTARPLPPSHCGPSICTAATTTPIRYSSRHVSPKATLNGPFCSSGRTRPNWKLGAWIARHEDRVIAFATCCLSPLDHDVEIVLNVASPWKAGTGFHHSRCSRYCAPTGYATPSTFAFQPKPGTIGFSVRGPRGFHHHPRL